MLHTIEADAGNARYWHRRYGKFDRAGADAEAELEAIRGALERG